MNDYEIRLYRADDTLALIVKTAASGLAEIEEAASAMLKGNIVRAELWGEQRRMAVLVSLTRG
jgi:hypothetical protein